MFSIRSTVFFLLFTSACITFLNGCSASGLKRVATISGVHDTMLTEGESGIYVKQRYVYDFHGNVLCDLGSDPDFWIVPQHSGNGLADRYGDYLYLRYNRKGRSFTVVNLGTCKTIAAFDLPMRVDQAVRISDNVIAVRGSSERQSQLVFLFTDSGKVKVKSKYDNATIVQLAWYPEAEMLYYTLLEQGEGSDTSRLYRTSLDDSLPELVRELSGVVKLHYHPKTKRTAWASRGNTSATVEVSGKPQFTVRGQGADMPYPSSFSPSGRYLHMRGPDIGQELILDIEKQKVLDLSTWPGQERLHFQSWSQDSLKALVISYKGKDDVISILDLARASGWQDLAEFNAEQARRGKG